MKTRASDFWNSRSKTLRFSFQVYIQKKWTYLTTGKRPMMWKTEAERDAKQALARKAKTTKELCLLLTGKP